MRRLGSFTLGSGIWCRDWGRWASPDPLHVHQAGGGEALNSYHYVSGNLLSARDPIGLWSTGSVTVSVPGGNALLMRVEPVHQMAISATLGSRVTADQLADLQQAQVDIDQHQEPEDQYMHAMTADYASPGWDERPDDIRNANRFVRDNLARAIEQYRAGDSHGAMASLGRAMHTLQDATSPSHEGFQLYDGPGTGQFPSVLAALRGLDHLQAENEYPGPHSRVGANLEGATVWAYDIFVRGVTDGEVSVLGEGDGTSGSTDPADIQFFDERTGRLMLPAQYRDISVTRGSGGTLPAPDDLPSAVPNMSTAPAASGGSVQREESAPVQSE